MRMVSAAHSPSCSDMIGLGEPLLQTMFVKYSGGAPYGIIERVITLKVVASSIGEYGFEGLLHVLEAR